METPPIPTLRLAGVGCGGRTQTYLRLAAAMPDRFRIVAAADPIPGRVERIRALSDGPEFCAFPDDRAFFAAPRLADVVVIGTQDRHHVAPCLDALERGYDVLLEKPVAPDLAGVLRVERRARELGRRVLVCHVLRYAPFYVRVKEILESGVLGDIVSINAVEGVGPWHFAHSYVRGHWAVSGRSTPAILAKCCHDLDLVAWFVGQPCESVASHGSLGWFRTEHAPAGAPARCTDGCPAAAECAYDAHRYLAEHRSWLGFVHDHADGATDAAVVDWLRTSPWGRCVYRCDNDAPDRQTVAMRFLGGATATLTMTAFGEGRSLSIYGTRGRLVGGDDFKRATGRDLMVEPHAGGREWHTVDITAGGYEGHGGADMGLVMALHREMTAPDPASMRTSITHSVQSHAMAFAAERSRLTGTVVNVPDLLAEAVG